MSRARALDLYHSLSGADSQAEATAWAQARAGIRRWDRKGYRVMRTAELEEVRVRLFRSIDAVMANGRCGSADNGAIASRGISGARRQVTVHCSFANINMPEEGRQSTRSRRQRLKPIVDSAARTQTLEPVRRFEATVDLYRPRGAVTASWKIETDSLLLFANAMQKRALRAIEENAIYLTRGIVHSDDMGDMTAQGVARPMLDSTIHGNKDSYLGLTTYHYSGQDKPAEASFERPVETEKQEIEYLYEGLAQAGYGPKPVPASLAPRVRDARCTVNGEESTEIGAPSRAALRGTASCLVRMPAKLTEQGMARPGGIDAEPRMLAFVAGYTQPAKHERPRAATASVVLEASYERWTRTSSITTPASELMFTLAKRVKTEVDGLFENYAPCCHGMGQ